MNFKGRSKSVAIVLACAAVGSLLLVQPLRSIAADGGTSTGVGGGPLNAPATQPAEVAPVKTIQELIPLYQASSAKMSKLFTPVASDPVKREEAAPKIIPVAYHTLDLIDQIGATNQVPPATIDQLRQGVLATLYLLNDAPTVTKVKDMIASDDTTRQLNGKSIELQSRWLAAGSNADDAGKVVDDVVTLAKANSKSSRVTMLTMNMAQTAHSSELKDRLMAVVTDVMTDPMAKQMSASIKAQAAAAAKQKDMLDKPFTIASKTVDGKDFTTADMKGKVILVDFWATWCGPCKASLPHVVETYNKYHDQGLEMVGIDNDYDAKSVTDFTPAHNMPWTQLFNADAAAAHKWNPLSQEYGVNGIPCMFLIDKKGVLRSVTARADMDDLIPKLLAE